MKNSKIHHYTKLLPKVNRRLTMKYTQEERLDIGRRIYEGEMTRYQAAEVYGISDQTARDYMRLYRDVNQLPAKRGKKATVKAPSFQNAPANIDELESMSKEQLIQELVKARIAEARLKKGYEVKGDGTVILYGNRNTK
jgi:transposase